MTLSCCSLCLFYLSENLRAAISVYFWSHSECDRLINN